MVDIPSLDNEVDRLMDILVDVVPGLLRGK
jgi:hypothetical protein